MNGLLGDNDIVTSGPTRNKATLVGANNFTQKRSDSPNKDFTNDFMGHVTEAYGAELFDSLRVLNFGNKSNESSIDLMGYRAGSKAIFDELTHSGTNNLPIEESETDTEESDVSGSDGDDTSWISWFCNLRGNEFFCEVDDEYIQDDFNLCGLSSQVPYYDYALDLILDVESSHGDSFTEEQNELVESAAEMLYGLIHVRYILSTKGMAAMLDKYKNFDFGRCPRVYCCGQPCLPVGQSDIPRSSTVKIYCPKCEDIYYPRSKYQGNIDGAYFGTTFPHLFLITYGHLKPQKATQSYVPRVFGFKIHNP